MNTKTRYVAITSLLVLTVGLAIGLVAYYAGLPASAFTGPNGPEEFQLIPADASLVAYADVRDIMASPLRQKVRTLVPMKDDGQREFENQTGINIETDIDHIVAAISPARETAKAPGSALVFAHGRFNDAKIEALMREHGATVEQYQGKRLLVAPTTPSAPALSLAFLDTGFVAVGTTNLVRLALDLKAGSGSNVTSNMELMGLVKDLGASDAWAVGHFDTLASQAQLPLGVSQSLPALTWFSASVNVDTGVRGAVRAIARDEAAAESLRDVVRGIVALARLQASSRPEFQSLLGGLTLGGTGTSVSLAFDVPAEAFDALSSLTGAPRR